MGAVFEGENTRIHRRVAIKVLHSTVAQDQAAVQRFEREAQAAGRIGNQHIVEVLDLGNLPDGDRYMVMEFLEGESLAERIKTRGRLPAAEVCNIALGMLEGLAAAHDVGIIHRDLKPDNVFLIRRGGQVDFVKLVDFGISKFNVVGGEFSMTRTGAVMGTPYYMSPEQAKGTRDIDHRVDLYAAGVILYEAVSGQVPFDAETFNELLFKIVLEDAPPIAKIVPELDAGFAQIVDKARSKDPALRYQTARDFQQALQQWASGAKVDFSFGATQALGVTPIPGGGAGSGTMGRATANAWAQSGEQPVPSKSKTWLLVAIAAVVLLGGILMALKLSSDNEGAARDAEAAQAEQARVAAEAVKDKEAAVKARQEAENAAQAASEKVKQAEAAAVAAQQQAAQQAQATAGAPNVRPLPPGTPPTVAVKPKIASKPAPVTAPSAKPSTSTGTSGSRKIRTSL
jgi:serine/threonine-protein kinase